MGVENVVSFCGIFGLLLVAWLLSTSHKTINARALFWGIGLQLLFGVFVFLSAQGRFLFQKLNNLVFAFLQFANAGSSFVFGKIAEQSSPLGFSLAFQSLPIVIFFAALMGLLYYSGIMPLIVRGFSWLFARTMKISGAESLSVASNIFVGIESAFVVRPYYNSMTASELTTVLAGCMATIASTVLGLYAFLLKDNFPTIAGHLISASLLTAPAVIVVAKLMIPETEKPATLGRVVQGEYQRPGHWVEAIYINAMEGARLAVGIGAMLIAMIGLLKAFNAGVGWVGIQFGVSGLSMERVLGYIFYPFVLLMGVTTDDAQQVSTLLGLRAIATEYPAYMQLSKLISSGAISPRSAVIATYALCGFAHIPAIAIFVGGIAAVAPKRAQDLGKLSLRALLAATIACMMTGAVAGFFYTGQQMILSPEQVKQQRIDEARKKMEAQLQKEEAAKPRVAPRKAEPRKAAPRKAAPRKAPAARTPSSKPSTRSTK
ncbi:MAG: nucleoside transporter [Deltaproteobacteria bacterium]|nr:MAG: nucleoside transporter [Deltaproteobacteria bacterium]